MESNLLLQLRKFLKLYFDQSKTSMKVSALTIYQFHKDVMNFSESMQDLMRSHGHTTLG